MARVDAGAKSPQPKVRSRKGGSAVPLDGADRRLMNLLQSNFPLVAEPFTPLAAQAGMPVDELLERTRRLLDERIIREITPIFDTRALGYASMLVAAKVDAENPQRAAAIVNSHPGVSHNYLRTHDFNLWFTIATPPDSELGLERTLEVLMGETGASSMRQLPTLTLFKINMNLEMEKGTEALAAAAESSPPRELEAQPYDDRDVAVIRALQGPMEPIERPYDEAAASVGMGVGDFLAHLDADGRAAAAAPGGGDPLSPPGRVLGQRDGGLARPRGGDRRYRAANGVLPGDLPLLPASHLPRLALQRLHHGPRPLEAGMRRDPRLDRGGVPDRRAGSGHPLFLDRVQEDPPAVLHRRLRGLGSRALLGRRVAGLPG